MEENNLNDVSTSDAGVENTNTGYDITPYLAQGGVNEEALTKLIKERDDAVLSRNFYHGKYSQAKNDVMPSDISGYGEGFKADSSYEKFLDSDIAKTEIEELKKFAKENGFGNTSFNKLQDFMMKRMVANGNWETRTPEQIEAEEIKERSKMIEKVEPMLKGLGRSLDENNMYIDGFTKSQSVFSNNPEMMDYFNRVSNDGAEGYMFATLIAHAVNHGGVPSISVPTASASVDKVSLERALQQESDPNVREALIRQYEEGKR